MDSRNDDRRTRLRPGRRLRVEPLESRAVPSGLVFAPNPTGETIPSFPALPSLPGTTLPTFPSVPEAPGTTLPTLPGTPAAPDGEVPPPSRSPAPAPPVTPPPISLPFPQPDGPSSPIEPDAPADPGRGDDPVATLPLDPSPAAPADATVPIPMPDTPEVPVIDPPLMPPEVTPAPDAPDSGASPIGDLIASAGPSPGADGTAVEVVVTFSEPIRAEGLSVRSFRLDRIGADGRAEPVFDAARPPSWRLDGGGTRLVLVPSRALSAGQYRLTLAGSSRFVTVGGQLIDADVTDSALADFAVAPAPAVPAPAPPSRGPVPAPAPAPIPAAATPTAPSDSAPARGPIGPTLADATPVGTIGPEVRRVDDAIDFEADPTAVRLYRVELAPGHTWRFGAEATGGRPDGRAIPLRLSLFDPDGLLIATADVGRADAPNDPFLFAGLAPGTYYVGVSASANIPGAGGYDPRSGAVGGPTAPRAGGPFSVAFVADVADAPARVLGLDLDHADPADPRPTGFTLRFDAAIRAWAPYVTGGTVRPGGLVEVVDEAGRVHPALAGAYDEVTGSLSFLLFDHLPIGRYEIRLPASEGLVDLAGRPPKATGLPPGVLGRFEVAAQPAARRPGDLGALLPAVASSGVSTAVRVEPGASQDVRFVVTLDAQYRLGLEGASGRVRLELVGPDGPVTIDTDPAGVNGATVTLRPGVYLLRLLNPGTEADEVRLSIRSIDAPLESVPLNGVGQAPALAMRLVSTAVDARPAGFDAVAVLSPAPGDALRSAPTAPTAPDRATLPIAVGAVDEAIAVGEGGPSASTGLMLTIDAQPIGRPTAQPLRVAAVPSAFGERLAATASTTDGDAMYRAVTDIADDPEADGRPGPREWSANVLALASAGLDAVGGPTVAADAAPTPIQVRAGLLPDPGALVDAALAMLRPLSASLLGWPADPDASPSDAAPPEEEGSPPDPDAVLADLDTPTDPLPMVHALGVGLLVGWTALRWRRRRPGLPPSPGPPPPASRRPRHSARRDAALVDRLARRYSLSALETCRSDPR